MPFETAVSYLTFERHTRSLFRFIMTVQPQAFLDAVVETSTERRVLLSKGSTLWRSQVGFDTKAESVGDRTIRVPVPFDNVRMKPEQARAREGRANPKGIPYLYCAVDSHTALCEARPGLGTIISLARLQTVRDLHIVDCSIGASNENPLDYFFNEPGPELRTAIVWGCIDRAFAQPVDRSDNVAEYVATQIIAEQLRFKGLDGIQYRSSVHEEGHNVVLFEVNDAEIVSSYLKTASKLIYEFAVV